MAENNENTKNTVEETGTVDTQTTNQNEGKAFKTFQTEEEYQNAVDSILKTKLPSKDEMKAFKKWQNSQKSEAQKLAEREAEYQKTNSKNTELQNENKVLRAGVKSKYVDFVAYSVAKKEGDFDKNLKQFLKENPEYTGSTEPTVVKKVSSSLNMSGKPNTNQNETNQAMNDLIRSVRN